MFEELEKINARPKPFEFYTAGDLWTGDHTSKMMLFYHLNEDIDAASRNAAFIDRSVEWIVSRFDIGEGTKIADFGCGPGLYAVRLARSRADVTGIDFSARSLEYARQAASSEGLSVRLVHQDYLEFESREGFRLILMIMCDYCALSPDQRRTMLEKFHALLGSGGSVLLDVYSLAAFERREEEALYEADLLDGFWSPNRYYGFLNIFKYPEDKVILEKYTIAEASGTRTVYNWFQHFTPETLERELAECGFAVEGFYSDVAGSPFAPESPEFAVIATKV